MNEEKDIAILAIKELLGELRKNRFADNDEGDYKRAVNSNKIRFWLAKLSAIDIRP